MKLPPFWRIAGVLLLVMVVGSSAAAPDQQAAADESVWGVVHFPVSCSGSAQATFDEGMAMQHSFAHAAASEQFEQAVQQDPACAMAYWGLALAALNNPLLTPPKSGIDAANRWLDQAERVGVATQRERDYIGALRKLVGPCAWAACETAFATAMGQMAASYPDDSEAAILYALALILAEPSSDLTFANRRKAASILQLQAKLHPLHPGVAHYLIHAYDTPLNAYPGEPGASICRAIAADYSTIAPSSPHALHMPSHIFTRLGRWDDSIASNLRSIAAEQDNTPNDELHAMDFLVYAYLQTGQDKAARAVQGDSQAPGGQMDKDHLGGPFAFTAIAARVALEAGDWTAAASLPDVPSANFPEVEAMTHYARAVGLARLGRPDAVRPELAALAGLEQKLHTTGNTYWEKQVGIEFVAAAGWVAFAGGRQDEGILQERAAAELDATANKDVVMPGPLAPPRELLGEMLLQAGRPADARAEFELVLKGEPRRFRSVFGAARAAELEGDAAAAKAGYAELLRIAAKADTDRPELRMARAFVDGQ